MKRPSLSQSLSIAAFLALSGVCLYLLLELKHVNRDLDAAAGQDLVQAITQRLDKVEDRLDKFAGSKPVQDADFRAAQQALSQRIDTAQAMLVEIQRANQTALQGMAQAGDLVALEAKLEGLQNDLSDLRKKAVEPAKAPPPTDRSQAKARSGGGAQVPTAETHGHSAPLHRRWHRVPRRGAFSFRGPARQHPAQRAVPGTPRRFRRRHPLAAGQPRRPPGAVHRRRRDPHPLPQAVRTHMRLRAFSSLLPLLLAGPVLAWAAPASPTATSTERDSQQRTTQAQPLDDLKAQEWGLSSQEYQRYRTLMQGSRGIYSPGLDPLTALGIEAQSDAERRHYAELQVRAEAQRVQKELAYEQAYRDAWTRLYPNLQPIQASGTAAPLASPVLHGSGRLAVFVSDNCAACTERVQALQHDGQSFDLYLIGSQGDDARIRRWAVLAGIDPAKVRARQITLNHDGGRWVQLGLGGELPAVVREVNGQWLRQ